jgi:hypothetical protein
MTFEEWQKTAQRIVNDFDLSNASEGFGLSNVVAVVRHQPGDIAELADGTYFTVFDRDEASGTLEEVQRALWAGWAEWETRVLLAPPPMHAREMYARLAMALQRIDAITDGSEWLAQRHIRRVMDAMADEFLDRTGGDLAFQSKTIEIPREVFNTKGEER